MAAKAVRHREMVVREMVVRRNEMAAKAVIGGLAGWQAGGMDHAHGHARTMHTVMGVSVTDMGMNATEGDGVAGVRCSSCRYRSPPVKSLALGREGAGPRPHPGYHIPDMDPYRTIIVRS